MTFQLPIRDPLLTLCHLACEEDMDSVLRQSCVLACQLFDVDCAEVLLVDNLGLKTVPMGGAHRGDINWSTSRKDCVIIDDFNQGGAVSQAVLSGAAAYENEEYHIPLSRKDQTVLGVLVLKTPEPHRMHDYYKRHEVALLIKAMSALISKALRHRQAALSSQELSVSLQKSDQRRSSLKDKISEGLASRIWGDSAQMIRVREDILRFSSKSHDFTVLGPNGSYKERIAMEVFNLSSQARSPFIYVNCKELTAETFAPLLFGYKRGAISGVSGARKGYFSAAGQGIIYFDRVETLSLELQERLERVLAQRMYQPLGSERSHPMAARCAFSMSNDYQQEQAIRDAMLSPLYNRITQFTLQVPSLNARRDDVPTIVEILLGAQSRKHKTELQMSPDIAVWLTTQEFEGDLRELESLIERAAVRAIGEKRMMLLRDFQDDVQGGNQEQDCHVTGQGSSLKEMICDFEKNIIIQSLKRHNHNRDLSAKDLNIPKRTLADKCKKYQLT